MNSQQNLIIEMNSSYRCIRMTYRYLLYVFEWWGNICYEFILEFEWKRSVRNIISYVNAVYNKQDEIIEDRLST